MQKVLIKMSANVAVEIASDNIKQLVEQASFWSSLPTECPLCKAPLIFFSRTTANDDSYWGQACTGTPIHEANFGVYKKEEKGFYYKGDWQKAYDAYQNGTRNQGDENNQAPTPATAQTPAQAPMGDPVARNLGDMVTAKQLGMIKAIAREVNVDADEECRRLMGCRVDELSKRAASDLIVHHLQMLQNSGGTAMPAGAKK